MAKDEKEGGASSGNDDDEAATAAAATAEPDGTLSLHNTFMDVVIRYVQGLQTWTHLSVFKRQENYAKLC